LVVGILEQSLHTETEKLDMTMEDVASSHAFVEGKAMPNTTRKKKLLLGNSLLLSSQYLKSMKCKGLDT
jgi:hypothetical protein